MSFQISLATSVYVWHIKIFHNTYYKARNEFDMRHKTIMAQSCWHDIYFRWGMKSFAIEYFIPLRFCTKYSF